MMSCIETGRFPSWVGNTGADTDVVLSTRVRLARNLRDRQFPLAASLQERTSVFGEVSSALRALPAWHDNTLVNFCGLPVVQQQFLVEERVASPDLLRIEGDRGLMCDAEHRLSVMINEEDHLRIQGLDSGRCADQVWTALDGLDTGLGRQVGYAFDNRKGFLTSCPTNSGTGLRVSFLLHLPGCVLTKTIEQVLQGASHLGMCIRGFFGEHSEVVGSFFQMSNQATLGAREEEVVAATQSAVQQIIGFERTARGRLLSEAAVEIDDKIFRAYGILQYARRLDVRDFLTTCSALRLGIVQQRLPGVTLDLLNRIMLQGLPAHMQVSVGKDMSDEEMDVARAELVRRLLKGY